MSMVVLIHDVVVGRPNHCGLLRLGGYTAAYIMLGIINTRTAAVLKGPHTLTAA